MSFGGLLFTNLGKNLQAKSMTGSELRFTKIVIGDGELGSGSILDLRNVVHEIKSLEITKLKSTPDGKAILGTKFDNNTISVGFYWREIGVFAMDPDIGEILYCYGNAGTNADYIPASGGAQVIEKVIDLPIIIGNATNVTATIASGVYVLVEDFENKTDIIDAEINALKEQNNSLAAYAVASGTNTYTATIAGITALTEGFSIKIKFTNVNTGASTLNINSLGAKSILKGNGSALSSGNIKAGQICNLVYNGLNFQLLGEGGEYGTATAQHVLDNYTIGTENGLIEGTMPNYGPTVAETINLTSEGQEYTIAPGYHSGLRKINAVITGLVESVIKAGTTVGGKVGTFTADATATAARMLSGYSAYVNGLKITGTILSKGAQTYTPGTTNQVISTNQYLSGDQTIQGSANLVAGNIKNGVNVFGVVGNYNNSGMSKVTANSMINVRSPDSSAYPDAIESSPSTSLSSGATFDTNAALFIISGSPSAQFSLTAASNILYRYYTQNSSPAGGTYAGVIGNSIASGTLPANHSILVYNPDKANITIARAGGSGNISIIELII